MKGGKHRASWKVSTESDFLNERQNNIKKEQKRGIVCISISNCAHLWLVYN